MKSKTIFFWLILALILSVAIAQQPSQTLRLQLPEGTIVYHNLSYVTDGHERQKLDLYLSKTEGKLPLIIWIHGGAWLAGSKSDGVPLDYLADGYAVTSINYRL